MPRANARQGKTDKRSDVSSAFIKLPKVRQLTHEEVQLPPHAIEPDESHNKLIQAQTSEGIAWAEEPIVEQDPNTLAQSFMCALQDDLPSSDSLGVTTWQASKENEGIRARVKERPIRRLELTSDIPMIG